MRVLITRPQPDADAFAQGCRDAGLDPIVAPLMSVRFHEDWEAPGNAGSLAFTSANGVRAFARASRVRSLTVYCVGEATAEAALAAGFANVHVAGGDVDSLAALIAGESGAVTEPIVHIAGTRRAGDLIAALGKRGITADRMVAYETEEAAALPEAARTALGSGRALAVALFSPRTARLFLDLVATANLTEALTRCRAICLSDAVANVAAEADWRVIDIASERNAAGMIAIMTGRA